MQITKRIDETEDDFLLRLYLNKKEFNLTWADIRDIANSELNCNYSSDKYRKDSHKYESYNSLLESDYDSDIGYILDEERLNKTIRSDELTQINAIYRRISRENSLKEIAADVASKISSKIKLDFPENVTIKNKNRVAILQLSDIHYGIEDETRWNKYNPEIAKERINKLQNKVIEYLKKEDIDTLYLVNLGDMIGGRIHLQLRLNSRIDVVTQAIEISEIISEFTNNISKYAKVHCYFTTDNHGRLEPNIKDSVDLESLSRLTPWFMKERLQDNKNVILHVDEKYGDDIVTFNILGHNVACCHGHKDKPEKIAANLSLYTKEHFDLILSSHFHHLAVEESNATIIVYNGSILSTDTFAEKYRLNSRPSQNLIICSEDDAMECIYKIDLS